MRTIVCLLMFVILALTALLIYNSDVIDMQRTQIRGLMQDMRKCQGGNPIAR